MTTKQTIKTRVTTSQETGTFNGWLNGKMVAQASSREECRNHIRAAILEFNLGVKCACVSKSAIMATIPESRLAEVCAAIGCHEYETRKGGNVLLMF